MGGTGRGCVGTAAGGIILFSRGSVYRAVQEYITAACDIQTAISDIIACGGLIADRFQLSFHLEHNCDGNAKSRSH